MWEGRSSLVARLTATCADKSIWSSIQKKDTVIELNYRVNKYADALKDMIG